MFLMNPCNRSWLIFFPRSKMSMEMRSTSSLLGAGPQVWLFDLIIGSPAGFIDHAESDQRAKLDTLSIEEATVLNIRKIRKS
jgi:hypothetical protein